jgi:hypothetical protein
MRPVAIATTPAAAVSLRSTTTESIDRVAFYLKALVSTATNVVCDIYDATDVDTAPPWPTAEYRTAHILAGADGHEGGYWTTERGGTSHYAASVARCGTLPTYRTFAQVNQAGPGQHVLRLHGANIVAEDCSTAIGDFTGQRIASLTVRAVLLNQGQRTQQVRGELGIYDSTDTLRAYPTAYQSMAPGTSREYRFDFPLNPATGLPWTLPEVSQFLVGGTAEFGVRLNVNLRQGDGIAMPLLGLDVTYTPETRVATARASVAGAAGWHTFVLQDPATDAPSTWAKAIGGRYWLALSQPSGTVPLQWYALDGAALDDVGTVTLPISTTGSGVLTSGAQWPPVESPTVPVYVLASGTTPSPDSAPYAILDAVPVSVIRSVQQDIGDLDTSAPYGVIVAYIRALGTAPPTAGLEFSVIDTGTGATVAGPARVSTSAVLPDPGTYTRVVAQLPTSFTPTAGHSYSVVISSDTPATNAWQVAFLDAVSRAWAVSGFGATTLAMSTITGGAPRRNDPADALVVLSQPPQRPSTLTAALYLHSLGQTGSGSCAVAIAYAIRLTWSGSSVPIGKFGYYEVQRNDDTTGWQTIARLADIDDSTVYDFESRRNVTARYRVRQVRFDGATSDWSPEATAMAPAARTDLLIVSNVAPDISVGYNFEPEDQTFTLLDSDEVVYRQLQGRDFQVEYRPVETRGDRFTRTITIAFADVTAPIGRSAFYPIEQVMRARVPLLTVLDGDGHRWYAGVVVGDCRRDEPGGRYECPITVTQLSGVPAAPIAAWSPGSVAGTLYGDEGGLYGDTSGTYAT